MLTIIYWAIIFYMFCLTVWEMFKEESMKEQAACALVLIPLVLRLLLIK